jgi:hypothetical protein
MAIKGAHSCQVCKHAERNRIELLVVGGGATMRKVALKFNLNRDAVRRHFAKHVPEERRLALIAGPDVKLEELRSRIADESASLLENYSYVKRSLFRALDLATELGDRNGTALVSGKLIETLNAIAKLTGALSQFSSVNITQNIFQAPIVLELQATLVRVLAKYPDARREVIAAIEDMERKTQGAPALPGPALPAPVVQPKAVDVEFSEVVS